MSIKKKVFVNILLYILAFYCLQIGVSYFVLQRININNKRLELQKLITRVGTDLIYDEGKWNTEMYLSDPLTPHPQGSSGFSTPLYVITSGGFVIERNLPIGGLLDSSDFKHLSDFTEPKFVQAATNEKWRVFSKLIKDGDKDLGIIFVSMYNPQDKNLVEIDKILQGSASKIQENIKLKDGNIDVSGVDIRNINYNISFEIVNVFNKVLLNNGRTPSFIDPSYVHDELRKGERIVRDSKTKISYFALSHELKDKYGKSIGIVSAAASVQNINEFAAKYLIYMSFFNLLILTPLLFFSVNYFINSIRPYLEYLINNEKMAVLPKNIFFDKKTSCIHIDGKKYDIPYASNQYYICVAIFSHPQKRWEIDELLESMGDNSIKQNGRKIYDAILAINKKVELKLIIRKNKTYQVNPDYLSVLIKN